MEWLLVLEGAVRASRAAAIVTGTLITVDSCAVLLDQRTRPPRPRLSALAWLVAGLAVAVVGSFLISQRVLFLSDLDREKAALTAVLFWGGLAVAFTIRALARAVRPWLTLASFVGLMAFGTALAVACPL
jgi:hypothetical protein